LTLTAPDWATLTYTFAGIWEIQPQSLEEAAGKVQIIDVREPAEYYGPLGHIRGALSIPLGELARRTGELDRERPVVAVCRSGARSAQATVILQQAGLRDTANLAGGMLRWRADGHAVQGGSN
jgi:rhodanese-related sulfurtransferase